MVDHLVVYDYKVKLIYGYISIRHTQCYSKRERGCVFNILFTQLFKHGKGKLITCIAQTLIHVISAIVDPTKMHFGSGAQLIQHQVCCKWKIWQIDE